MKSVNQTACAHTKYKREVDASEVCVSCLRDSRQELADALRELLAVYKDARAQNQGQAIIDRAETALAHAENING